MRIEDLNKCIINLPRRTDRLQLMKAELVHIACADYHLVEGVEHKVPKIGIAMAHLKCVQLAKDNHWPAVLIMEDDCVFHAKERTLSYINAALLNAPPNWDILLGGLYDSSGLTQVNSFWLSTRQFSGLHFYIVAQKAYDTVLKHDFRSHIDRAMKRSDNSACYVTAKFFATQRDRDYSDNVKRVVNYSEHLKKFDLL